MKKRIYVALRNEKWQYLHDIDSGEEIMWTNKKEYYAIFDKNDDFFGKNIMNAVEHVMNTNSIKFEWVNVEISVII